MCMRIVTFDFSLKYIFHFFLSVRRYLVVGSRYDFFFSFYKKLKNVSCEYYHVNG